jgi:hypothetical protein
MKRIKYITGFLVLGVVFSLILAFPIQATDETAGRNWANNNLVNKNKVTSIPIWGITQPGRANSIRWEDHAANRRFSVYEDLVLDKETGLIWYGRPFCDLRSWHIALWYARNFPGGDRLGWRLPTLEEFLSLLDPTKRLTNPALPDGHPFVNVNQLLTEHFWTSTTYEVNSDLAYSVSLLYDNRIGVANKREHRECWWPVRGGNGYATGNW